MATIGHVVVPHLQSVPYDPIADFQPVALVATATTIAIVNPALPVKTLAELVDLARAEPGKLNYLNPGNGTSPHLAGELLKALTKVEIAAVPYKGGAPSLADLMGGHIPMSFNNIPESIAQIRAGTIRPLGVTTAARSSVLPDVPSIGETVPTYDTGVWWGVLAPAGLPGAIRDKIAKDVGEALKAPAVKNRLTDLGAATVGSSPAEFGSFIRAEYEKWGPIIKAAGIKAE
jgi:tripartite-type tricarboxylate transporter receptor subunit TctC